MLAKEIKDLGSVTALSTTSTQALKTSFDGLSGAQIITKTTTLGLTEAQKLELIQNYATDKANYQTAISTEVLSAANVGATGTTTALGTAVQGLRVKLNGLWATHPILLSIIAAAAVVYGAFKAYDFLTVSLDEAADAASSAAEKNEELLGNIESINSELKTTNDRIKELETQGSLSFIEQDELQRLKDTTKELAYQLETERALQKIADHDSRDSAVDYLTRKNTRERYTGWVRSDAYDNPYGVADYETYSGNTIEYTLQMLKDYEDLSNRLTEIKELQREITDTTLEKAGSLEVESRTIYHEMDVLSAEIEKIIPNLNKFKKSLSADEDSGLIDNISDVQDYFVNIFGNKSQNITDKFNAVWESVDFKKYQDELTELAKVGKITPEVLESNENYNRLIEATGTTATEVADHIKCLFADLGDNLNSVSIPPISKSGMIADINELSSGFESLNKIMASIQGKNPFDYSLLDNKDFKDTFSEMGDSYVNFIEQISNTPNDINACQSSFNDLVTTWLESTGILSNVTDETANLTAAMLSNTGILNAEAVVTAALNANKIAAKLATIDFTKSVGEQIGAMRAELETYNLTASELDTLTIAYGNAQNSMTKSLSDGVAGRMNILKSELQAIKGVADAYNLIAGKINESASKTGDTSAEAQRNFNTNMKLNSGLDDQVRAVIDYGKELDKVQALIDNATNSKGNMVYGGGSQSNKSGGKDSKSKEETTQEIDWLEKKLQRLKDQKSQLESEAAFSLYAYLGLTQEEFDRAQEILHKTDGLLTEDYQELATIANNAGISLQDLYTIIENGGAANSKRSYLAQIVEQDKLLLDAYEDAIEKHRNKYEELATTISDEMRNKIEYNSSDIDILPDEEGKKVQEVISAYEKWQGAINEMRDLKKDYINDIKAEYDNAVNYIDQQMKHLENTKNLIKGQMDYAKASGQIVTAYSYEEIIFSNEKSVAYLEKKISERKKELERLMQEGLATDDEDYYDIVSEIEGYEESIQSFRTEIQKTYNDLLMLPIENMDVIISMYESITGTIQRWGAEMEASGRKLSSDYYQSLINNGMQVIDQYKEQYGLVQNIMGEYQTGSDQWNKLYSKMQSINSAMSSMVENLYKWNEALLQMPLDSISTYSSSLQKVHSAMSAVQSDYDTVISAVTSAIEDEIDLLNKERDAITETCDAEINVIRERLNLLNQQNEALQKQAAYEQALYDLQKANTQKTEKVIRDGEIVYETNADNLRSAQESVQDALFDLQTYELEKQLEGLETALDAVNDKYDEQISALEKISEKWSEISDKIAQTKNEALTAEILGAGWKDKVLSGNDEPLFQMFSGMYQTLSEQITQYEEQIESTDNISALLEDYINAYKAGTVTYDQAAAGINELLSQINQKMSAMEHLDQVFDFLSATTGGEANAEGILTAVQSSLTQAGDELIKSFQQYNENAALISEYTTSWQQLTENVSDIKDILADVRDNLEDALDEIQHLKNDLEDDEDKDRGVISSGQTLTVGGGGIASSYYTGGGGYVNSGPGVQSYAQGIRGGLLGENNDARRESLLKMISGQNLGDPSQAIPIIAHEGEAVLNRSQQDTLLSNFIAACSYVPDYPVPSYSLLSASNSQEQTNTFNFGGITIERCDSPDQLAEGILHGGLESAIRQSLGKYN